MRATVRPPPDAALPAVAATPSPYRAPPPRRPPETCVNPGRVRPMSRDMSDTSPGTYVLRPDTTLSVLRRLAERRRPRCGTRLGEARRAGPCARAAFESSQGSPETRAGP